MRTLMPPTTLASCKFSDRKRKTLDFYNPSCIICQEQWFASGKCWYAFLAKLSNISSEKTAKSPCLWARHCKMKLKKKKKEERKEKWVCHQGGRQWQLFHFSYLEYRLSVSRLWLTELQLPCSKGDISAQQQLPPTTSSRVGTAGTLSSQNLQLCWSISMAHLCSRAPVLPWQKLLLWCSVSTQIPLFGSLPLSGVQLGQAFSFFKVPFGHFSRFLLIHPYSCLLFTQHALLTVWCTAGPHTWI